MNSGRVSPPAWAAWIETWPDLPWYATARVVAARVGGVD